MLRGEVWTAVWPADPKRTERPVLVVSNNIRNQSAQLLDVVVARITSAERADGSRKPVNPAEDLPIALKKASIVKCGAIFSLEKTALRRRLQQLAPAQMRDVDARLKVVLDLH